MSVTLAHPDVLRGCPGRGLPSSCWLEAAELRHPACISCRRSNAPGKGGSSCYSLYLFGPSSKQKVIVNMASSSKNSVVKASHHRLSHSWGWWRDARLWGGETDRQTAAGCQAQQTRAQPTEGCAPS